MLVHKKMTANHCLRWYMLSYWLMVTTEDSRNCVGRGTSCENDLSYWICELSQTKALAAAVVKPYLRNLFYRILRLHVEYGVSLVFVIDGAATPMKWATMDRRMAASGHGKEGGRTTKIRHQLNSRVREVTSSSFPVPMLLSYCIERLQLHYDHALPCGKHCWEFCNGQALA